MSLSRRRILALGAALPAAGALSGAAVAADASTVPRAGLRAGGYGPVVPLEPGDTAEQIIAKAARVAPTTCQLAWQRQEITVFTHYGMNTFTGREWGSGAEDPAWFAPERVDVEQWMRAYRASGAELVMLTAKHHDGFVLYPSRYTRHSVKASPWDGDILGRYVTAARAAGLKVGVYLSPADGAELPHDWHAEYVKKIRAKHDAGLPLSIGEESTLADGDRTPGGHGRYGNGSEPTARTVPALTEGDSRAGAVSRGELPSFEVTVDDYDAYYLNQVYELFTEYGPFDELWLDGANPWADAGITQEYDFAAYYELFGQLSPGTVVFGAPRGIRWIGNEDGIARGTEWSVVPVTGDGVHMEIPGGESAADLGSRERLTGNPEVRSLRWFPGEADVSIREGWYHHPEEQPKAARELVTLYEKSVGRNSLLLLNVPPSRAGTVDEADIRELAAFHGAVRQTYETNLLAGGSPAGTVAALTGDDPGTAWSPDGGSATGSVELELEEAEFDRVRLGEDVHRGQRVEEFALDIQERGGWKQVASGTTVGCSRIVPLDSPVTAGRIRLRISAARAAPRISFLGLHRSVARD